MWSEWYQILKFYFAIQHFPLACAMIRTQIVWSEWRRPLLEDNPTRPRVTPSEPVIRFPTPSSILSPQFSPPCQYQYGVIATLKVDHSLGATPLEVPEGGGYQSGTIQAGAWEDVVLLTQEGATSNQLGRRSPPAVAAVESQNQFLTEVDTDAAQVCSITDC